MRPVALIVMAFVALLSAPVSAHEVRPAYLEIAEKRSGQWHVTWKQPVMGEQAKRIVPHLSNGLAGSRAVVRRPDRHALPALVDSCCSGVRRRRRKGLNRRPRWRADRCACLSAHSRWRRQRHDPAQGQFRAHDFPWRAEPAVGSRIPSAWRAPYPRWHRSLAVRAWLAAAGRHGLAAGGHDHCLHAGSLGHAGGIRAGPRRCPDRNYRSADCLGASFTSPGS